MGLKDFVDPLNTSERNSNQIQQLVGDDGIIIHSDVVVVVVVVVVVIVVEDDNNGDQ